MVAPQDYTWLKNTLEMRGIEISIMIEDVQPLIDAQMRPRVKRVAAGWYEQYHNMREIDNWMDRFAAENSNMVTMENVTTTYEGRTVRKIVIRNSSSSKKIFFMIGGTNSNEWISPATVMQVAEWLVLGRSDLVEFMDFHIIPVLNQDGYAYTWKDNGTNRMWRKTRSPNSGSDCIGTDPSRNYDWQWTTGIWSNRPCSSVYTGKSAALEIEVSGLQDHVLAIKDDIEIFMDVQAYGQHWMYPWAYTRNYPDDISALHETSKCALCILKQVHGTDYGSIANVFWATSGSSADWAYGNGIKHSYNVHLRDNGIYGFILPADQIKPNSEEFYAGIDAMVHHIILLKQYALLVGHLGNHQ